MTVCQIGYELRVQLEQRVLLEKEKYDLMVFVLYEEELKKIGGPSNPKSGFKYINTDIEMLLKYQNYKDPNTWAIHIAGFPGVHKITHKINSKEIQENFGIVFFPLFAKYFPDPMGNNGGPKISFDFDETRKAICENYFKIDIGQPLESPLILGGISGCPVFARCSPNQDDLTLLGIVYEGPSNPDSLLPEIIYARPVSLIEEILKG